ncbi:MAG: hypothetical protein A2Z93_10485 [Curvibacter sp. GWA2_64_110]|nr:MAG: hypothetical protein A2Z93_10485 [Curvibacter sp. GWA2_64_110]HCY16857.1 hypothetical protein [Curvibacter sp.]
MKPPASGQAAPPTLAALTLLLTGLSGRNLTVQALSPAAPDSTAEQRPILSASHLLLPADAVGACHAQQAILQRAAMAHAAAHLLYSPPAQTSSTLKPMGLAVVSAIEDARVEALLMQRLPGVRRWFVQSQAESDPHGLDFASLIARLGFALLDEQQMDGSHWVHKARTLFAAARQQHGLEDYIAFRRLAGILANDLGQMRVRFNPRQYAVPAPYRDDNSYLWQHGASADAPSEALQVQVPAAPPPSDSTDDTDTAQATPEDGPVHLYPEWDYRLQRERRDWCTVREAALPHHRTRPTTAVSPDATLLQPPPSRRLSRSQRLRRQWEGEDIDLDAAIDIMVERRLRLAPDGRLFMRAGHETPRCSVLVLLDLSASTGERLAGAQHSLLEVEQQAALLLARSALAGQDRIAIHGFASDTRAAVHYVRLLDFGAALDAASTSRILSTRAAWSTRIGAALRHATQCLQEERSEQRAIVLVTDGAPSDIDVFDTRHLTEDARAAVQEAQRQGVQTYGLAVDPGADAYVHRIFGWRNYRIVETAAQLPRQLTALYAHLAAV